MPGTASGERVWGPDVVTVDPARLAGATIIVGRGSDATIRLTHPSVSKAHAVLTSDSTLQVILRDQRSRFGTRVNGERVRERILKEGDRVEFGPVAYEYLAGMLRLVQQTEGADLEVAGMSVVRGGALLLEHLGFSIASNQFVGVLGASGSGKTTLIKTLASFLSPAAGLIRFNDQDLVENVEAYRAILGYVPQEDVLHQTLSVRQNLEYALRLRVSEELTPDEKKGLVNLILDRLGLSDHSEKAVKFLSGGQRKRVNVGMELLARPRILFLDEPTSGLDPASEARLMRLLKDLASRGTTVVCSTHVMESIQLFDQVIVIADRGIAYAGPPIGLLPRFNVKTHSELYATLETYKNSAAVEAAADPEVRKPSALLSRLLGNQTVVKTAADTYQSIRWKAQIAVLFRRGAHAVLADTSFLIALTLQPLLIGMLINLSQLRPNGLDPVFLFAVVASIWFGLNNAAREVVRDRPIYLRERLAGVTPEGYLAAKVLLYAAIGLIQIVILACVLRYANFLSPNYKHDLFEWPFLYVITVLLATYLGALLLGLTISTIADSQEFAIAALPIVILPQLLLTGVATGLTNTRDGSFTSLVLFCSTIKQSTRGFSGWILEFLSMGTFSRPALSLFKVVRAEQVPVSVSLVRLVDWLHLLLLLSVAGSLLVWLFHKREKRWMNAG